MNAPVKAPSGPLIEAPGVTRHFGGSRALFARTPLIRAVNNVSLAIERGETFAIVGESGCGKSSLARVLVRLIEPTAGQVFYQGTDLVSRSPEEMRKLRGDLQFIFQDPFASLNPRMRVGDIIGERLWIDGVPTSERRDRVDQLIRTVGLMSDHADRYPHEFSGGQRQRIGIARALAGSPKLIIGDEPVSALDVSIQAQIINLLEDLKAEFGLTLIIVAHDLAVIRHMSDRVAVMYLGAVVETATTDALFETPLHPYTRALLAAIPVPVPGVRARQALLQGDVPSPANPPPGCTFHTRCPHAVARCKVEVPAVETPEPGRSVACHLWRELAASGGSVLPLRTGSAKFAETLAIYRRGRAAASDTAALEAPSTPAAPAQLPPTNP